MLEAMKGLLAVTIAAHESKGNQFDHDAQCGEYRTDPRVLRREKDQCAANYHQTGRQSAPSMRMFKHGIDWTGFPAASPDCGVGL